MYKRYLEPSMLINPTKYISKKLKLCGNSKPKTLRNDLSVNGNELQISPNNRNEAEGLKGQREDEVQYDFVSSVTDNDNASDNGVEDNARDNDSNHSCEGGSYAEQLNNNAMNTEDFNEEEDLENDDFFNSMNEELIHPNLDCKTADAIIMLLDFFLHHQLTWVALADLLKLFHSMLGYKSRLPKTKYFFKKIFGQNQRAVFHFYCRNCNLYIDTFQNLKLNIELDEAGEAKKMNCSNCQHSFSLHKMNDGHFFIQLPLRHQICQKIAKNPGILNYNTAADPNNLIRDVYDGMLYKDLRRKVGKGKLITLTMNTDGVRVFKSKSKSSLWPIQMFINEVPALQRFKLGNIILNGIWFGKSPDVALYLKPLTDELDDLDTDKIQVEVDNKCYDITVRGLLMTADTVARCKLLNLKQYNGGFGCTYCLHPGKLLNGSKTSKYPLATNEYCKRTHSSTLTSMTDFLTTGKGSSGIKGISPLIAIKDYDLIRGTVIDYMHCVLLGVVCLLLDLWFDSVNHFQNYYINPRRTEVVNQNIKSIKSLKSFSRRPRPIYDKSFWKANEFRNWLLHFAIPCLQGSLKNVYLRHFSLLSEAIFLFLKTNISTTDFDKASRNLRIFVKDFQKLYGEENMMYNVHLLEHLSQCVKDCGPLWTYSNFNFENNNGSLVKYVKGTTDVEKQIATKYFYNNVLESLKESRENARNYIDGIQSSRVINTKKIGFVTLFGKPQNRKLKANEQRILHRQNILEYQKLFFSHDVFYSKSYKRATQTDDTTVCLKDGSFGQIRRIYVDSGTVYVLLRKFCVEASPFCPSHLRKVKFGILESVRADEISEKCVLVTTTKEMYLSQLPNRVECD